MNVSYDAAIVGQKLFTDMSSDLSDGGKIINIPNLSGFGAADTKTNAQAVVLEADTDTDVNLTVDTWITKAFSIEDREAMQVKQAYNIMSKKTSKAAQSVAEALENAIFALIPSFTNKVGTSTAKIQDSDVRDAIEYLENENANQNEMFFIFHPSVKWSQLMAIEKYVNFDYSSTRTVDGNGLGNPMARGLNASGALYGIPVYTSTLLPTISGGNGRYGILAVKDAIAFATLNFGSQDGNKVRLQTDYRVDLLGTLVVADMCYGVVLNRDTDGAVAFLSEK